jgi:micrococcal nuclease
MQTLLRSIIILSISHFSTFAQLSGKVIKIADGDTFTMLIHGNKQVKVRLQGIDCPEKSQDFGNVAKGFLSEAIYGKQVKLHKMGIDRYGRTLAIVTIGTININEELLKEGLAWYYTRYSNDPYWAKLEYTARLQKKGLWAMPNPSSPWDYRKSKARKRLAQQHQVKVTTKHPH